MNKIEKLTKDLSAIIYRDWYKVEVDTEDIVLGFTTTLTKGTNNLATALRHRAKTIGDLGRFISPSVRIVAIRWYKNDNLIKEFVAEPVESVYNS